MNARDRQAANEAVGMLRALHRTWGRGWLGNDWNGVDTLKELQVVTDSIEQGLLPACRHLRFRLRGRGKGVCASCGVPMVKKGTEFVALEAP